MDPFWGQPGQQITTQVMSEQLESLSPAASLLFPSLGSHLILARAVPRVAGVFVRTSSFSAFFLAAAQFMLEERLSFGIYTLCSQVLR